MLTGQFPRMHVRQPRDRSMIGEDCLQLGYMTLMTGMGEYDPAPAGDRQSLELIAVFDDHGELAGLPSFSLWSKAFGQRMTVFGRSIGKRNQFFKTSPL